MGNFDYNANIDLCVLFQLNLTWDANVCYKTRQSLRTFDAVKHFSFTVNNKNVSKNSWILNRRRTRQHLKAQRQKQWRHLLHKACFKLIKKFWRAGCYLHLLHFYIFSFVRNIYLRRLSAVWKIVTIITAVTFHFQDTFIVDILYIWHIENQLFMEISKIGIFIHFILSII